MSVIAIVPLKKNSRRLNYKNLLSLDNRPLAYHIFNTLKSIKEIDEIYCYSSSKEFMKFLPDGIGFLKRPKKLDGDNIKANELFMYAAKKLKSEFILLTHATNPFIKKSSIIRGIKAVKSKKYDCSFAVLKHQKYGWYKKKPFNYNPFNMSQTQSLEPLFTETSGFYFFKRNYYLKTQTRISTKPYLVEVSEKEAIDIDNLSDYNLSKKLINFSENEKNNIFDLIYLNNLPTEKLKKKIKHISFDLDGVLIDSYSLMNKSWNFSMKKNKLNYRFSEYKKYIGLPFRDILKNMGIAKKYWLSIDKEYNYFSISHSNFIKPYKNIKRLLKNLIKRKFKISIITSKNYERTNEILHKYFNNIKFSIVITPDDVKIGRGKPFPDSLYLACLKTGVSLDQTIFIGDMYSDYLFAKNCKVNFIHAKWGYSKENLNAISIENINYLEKLFNL